MKRILAILAGVLVFFGCGLACLKTREHGSHVRVAPAADAPVMAPGMIVIGAKRDGISGGVEGSEKIDIADKVRSVPLR